MPPLPPAREGWWTSVINAMESMNSSLRKVIKSQQIFPSAEAAFKLVYLAMGNISNEVPYLFRQQLINYKLSSINKIGPDLKVYGYKVTKLYIKKLFFVLFFY